MEINNLFFDLIRFSLGKAKPYLFDPQNVNWNELMMMARRHGVFLVTLDALQQYDSMSPVRLSLEEDVLFSWLGQQILLENQYFQQKKVLQELSDLFVKQGLQTMVLKGYGISLCYPIPEHRECGDIDIVLFRGKHSYGHDGISDWLQGNMLIESEGIKVKYENKKHSVFEYKGVTVELHNTCLDASENKLYYKSEVFLQQLLEYSECKLTTVGFYLPPIEFHLLFLLRHMSRHFRSHVSIKMRHILDWGLFLQCYSDQIDWGIVSKGIRVMRLEKMFDVFTSMAEDVIGTIDNKLPFTLSEELISDAKNRFWKDILMPKEFVENMAVLDFRKKIRRYCNQYWKFDYLPETFLSVLKTDIYNWMKYHL